MDVPDLVRQAVGDEELRAGVNLGDEDAVVFTPTRALVYRGEGLLSDEDVAAYDFDFERLAVSEGRRKTKFTMTYVDGERSFTVPGKRTDDVLENLIEGMLRVAEAIDPSESVTGVFRFSEMSLVVTEGRLLKHIGEYTWDSDFEAFPYDELTKLAFEEGSVATQVVLGVGERSERIKAPNAEAGLVRKALQQAVFSHYGVDSLERLNRQIAVEPDDDGDDEEVTGGFGLDSGIDPLVSEEGDAEPAEPEVDLSGDASSASGDAAQSASSSGSASSEPANASAASSDAAGAESTGSPGGPGGSPSASESSASQSASSQRSKSSQSSGGGRSSSGSSAAGSAARPSSAANDAVKEQLSDLTQAVERQNELLHRHQQTIEKLIEELRKGR